MTQPARKYYRPEEYLALEEAALYKSDFYRGQMFVREGGSFNHNLICSNIIAELNLALRKEPCSILSSDMRLLVQAKGLYTYPDAMVVCGKVKFAEGRNDTITNPVLIVEVLSPSTRSYDLKGKFALYQALPSLQNYLTVDQQRVYVEYYHRTGPRSWGLETFESLEEVISLEAIGVDLPLSSVYDKVEFETGNPG